MAARGRGGREISGLCECRTEELPATHQSEQVQVTLDTVVRTGAPPSSCCPMRRSLSWPGAPSSPWTLSIPFSTGSLRSPSGTWSLGRPCVTRSWSSHREVRDPGSHLHQATTGLQGPSIQGRHATQRQAMGPFSSTQCVVFPAATGWVPITSTHSKVCLPC